MPKGADANWELAWGTAVYALLEEGKMHYATRARIADNFDNALGQPEALVSINLA
jgi:hypothetical protein